MKIVFDSFAWIEYFMDTKNAEILEGYLKNNEIITSSAALLELSYRADQEKWDIKKHLAFIKLKSRIVGFNDEFILRFGVIYNKLKEEVKEMGFADIIIYATAILHDAKVLTGDSHFKYLDRTILLK